jgi:hypothetical protein
MKILKTFKQMLIHEGATRSLSRIWQHTKESNIAMITAYRGEFDKSKNEKRNRELKSKISSAGFGYVQMTGNYIENKGDPDQRQVEEKSFFITSSPNDNGKLKSFVTKMGKLYNQDSVFYKSANSDDAYLIGTASGRFPGMGKEHNLGKFRPQKTGEYWSKMKNNKVFTFESVEMQQYPLIGRAASKKLSIE